MTTVPLVAPGIVATQPLARAPERMLALLLSRQKETYVERFGPAVAASVDRIVELRASDRISGVVLGSSKEPLGYVAVTHGSERGYLSALWLRRGAVEDVGPFLKALVRRTARGQLVEAQDLGFGEGDLGHALASVSVRRWRRLYLSRDPRMQVPAPHAELVVRPFRESDALTVSSLAFRAFAHTPDFEMSSTYRSLSGCLDRIFSIVHGDSWGPLLPAASPVAVDGAGRTVGFALVTDMGRAHAHLVETAVCPSAISRGVGAALLDRSLAELRQQGFESLRLSVTESNERALRLYRRAGFETVRTFHAYLLDPGKPDRRGKVFA